MSTESTVRPDDLERFSREVLVSLGARPADAELVSAALVDADLRGLDSHGVLARLPGYAQRLREGGIRPDAELHEVQRSESVVVLDNGGGFGQVAAVAAGEAAAALAAERGVGVAAVRNSNHLGAVGYFTRVMTERFGVVALAATGGGPRIAPWAGAEPLLATNPWSMAFPAEPGHPAVVVDVSNGAVLTGSVDEPATADGSIPPGWALDSEGRPTTDARAGAAGSLLPFGGAKGAALTFGLEILASVLTGAAFSKQVPSLADPTRTQQLGHLFLALDVGSFLDPAEFRQRLGLLLSWVEGSRPVPGSSEVRVPGVRGARTADVRRRDGVPTGEHWARILELADECGLRAPQIHRQEPAELP